MYRIATLALALMLGTGTMLEGQTRNTRNADLGPIDMLLNVRSEIGLTPDQIVRLERIDARMDAMNRPLVDRLGEIRKRTRSLGPRAEHNTEQRAQYESLMTEARPIMREISRNNRTAMEQVGEVLTDGQRARVADMIRERVERERSRSGTRVPNPGN
jgi:hypothetical protein